jgi:hypothetical protein
MRGAAEPPGVALPPPSSRRTDNGQPSVRITKNPVPGPENDLFGRVKELFGRTKEVFGGANELLQREKDLFG